MESTSVKKRLYGTGAAYEHYLNVASGFLVEISIAFRRYILESLPHLPLPHPHFFLRLVISSRPGEDGND